MSEDGILIKQALADHAAVSLSPAGLTDSATQKLANSEQSKKSEPTRNTIELGRDAPLLGRSNAQILNSDKTSLASVMNEVPRQKLNQTDSQLSFRSPVENEVRLTPQQVMPASNTVGQPVTLGATDVLRSTPKGEEVAKVNFENVPEMRQDARIGGPSTVPPQFARPEISQAFIRQMTDAVRAQVTAEKTIEIALRPAELGRVRIALSPADAGMIVTISAERAETLELMRRNIDYLSRTFAEICH
jgi:flagellar hook-length control protein FliK